MLFSAFFNLAFQELEHTFSLIGCDKNNAEDFLKVLQNYEDFHCLAVCNEREGAMESILKQNPSLVFIDIDNKKDIGDPFHFIHELHQYLEVLPSFVAFSSSKKKAYQTIKNNFFDYLLKPFRDFEIRKCLMKFRKTTKQKQSGKLCLRSYSDYQFLDLSEIQYLKADNNTTDFYLLDTRKVSAFKTLKYFEESLPEQFLRVHHSYLINTRHIVRINFGKSFIYLKGRPENIPFSKSYKEQVFQLKERFYTSLSVVG